MQLISISPPTSSPPRSFWILDSIKNCCCCSLVIGVRTQLQFVCHLFSLSWPNGFAGLWRFISLLMDLIRWSLVIATIIINTHEMCGTQLLLCNALTYFSRVIENCNFSHSISFSYRMTWTINSIPLPIRIDANMFRTGFCVCVS